MVFNFDGRSFSGKKELRLKKEVARLKKRGINPKLVSILVGDDPASKLYVSLKKKAAERIECMMEVKELGRHARYSDIYHCINKLNFDPFVHGIIVQMPLPKSFTGRDRDRVLRVIDPSKDVDGLRENSKFLPATVKAVLQIIKVAKGEVKSDFENAVVVGASGMVGKPLAEILSDLGYKVIKCDINTKDLSSKTLTADLLISATGVPNLIKGDMVKSGVAVIDVGSPKGDVKFEEVSKKAAFITPVPGGVGPVTIVSLLENLIISAKMGKPL